MQLNSEDLGEKLEENPKALQRKQLLERMAKWEADPNRKMGAINTFLLMKGPIPFLNFGTQNLEADFHECPVCKSMFSHARCKLRKYCSEECSQRRLYSYRASKDFITDNIQIENGCWRWCGYVGELGYGIAIINGKSWLMHRRAWTVFNGEIPFGKFLCHKCDNPPCCNPDHLFLGTQADNLADCRAKKRNNIGIRNGSAKLTEKQVIEIRQFPSYRGILTKLALSYNVTHLCISDIRNGKTWKHLL